ncbi:homeobox protein PKNOX2-like [Alosa sapidissima]|uniref:homeobox protein PKNOX2-like n=1 Tax=Alosa sapidissima TaxID=34773 RepID=UPI001C0915D2|nr:homeobox protein PKNOX2-like [Alosa sapidissima]XP_041924685.1 homeobox protein PKNOX2-like [Alosa sapidissima]
MMPHACPTPAVSVMSAKAALPPTPYPDGQQMTGATPQHSSPQPALPPSSSPGSAPLEPPAQLEVDKQAIYRHPLFSLLGLLFEKCERATQGSDGATSASFDVDIQNFVHQQEQEHKPFFSEDPELDNLVVKAIQVLRIHLMELEKVRELCKDFCQRYITCLQTQMHSDNLLRSDLPDPDREPGLYSAPQSSFRLQQDLLRSSTPTSPSTISNPISPSCLGSLQQADVTMTTVSPPARAGGGALYQPITMLTLQGQLERNLSSLLDKDARRSRLKRSALPKHATNIMRSWLFQHLMHPYPTEDEKRHIATQTHLSLLQVNNWFINARRRILQPMLEASNPDPAPKTKRMKSHRPTQRFWPLATGSSTVATGQATSTPEGTGTGEGVSESTLLAMRRALLEEEEDSADSFDDEDEFEEMEEEEEEDGGEKHQHPSSMQTSKSDTQCSRD